MCAAERDSVMFNVSQIDTRAAHMYLCGVWYSVCRVRLSGNRTPN